MSNRATLIGKWVLLLLLAAYSVGMTVWAHSEARRHVCKSINVEVEGNNMMDSMIRRGVKYELSRYTPRIIGSPLHTLNTRRIESYLASLNNFESVDCMVSSDGKLQVSVVPLVPVMRVFFKDNSYYINREGKHIESRAEFYNDVPIVSGEFSRKFQPVAVLPLVRFIQNDERMSDYVSMIVAKGPNDLLIVPRVKGHIVNFGDTTRLPEKWENLKLFYQKVMPYKGWEEYDTISVKFRGQIVATRRDKTRLNHGESYFEEEDLEEATLPDVAASPDTIQNKKNKKTGGLDR